MLSSPDHWTLGDSGQLGNDWRMTDVAVSDKGVLFAYEQNQSMYSPNLMGSFQNATAVNTGYFLMNQSSPNAGLGVWNAWTMAGKIFCTNGNSLYQVVEELHMYNSTSTVNYPLARAYLIGEWGNNGTHIQNTGVSYIQGRGNLVYLMTAHTDTTFSVYNSTVPIYEVTGTITS